MKKITIIAAFALSTALMSFSFLEPSTWTIDKGHSKLGFSITHLMVSEVEGGFKFSDVKITAVNEDFSDAVVEMTADAKSINTDNEKRDEHLRSADFMDTEKFPTITFKSKSFKKAGDKTYKVTGDLTMHGVTKSVELNAVCRTGTNPMSKKLIAGFKISGTIKRTDFGIGATTPAAMLSDEIMLNANAEFAKQ
jgi:polyisoprenoid-binding protein YceI